MAKSPACYVTKLDLSLANKLKEGMIDQGFEMSAPPYTLFSGKKKGVSCTLYQSGKVTVQGKDKDAFIEFFLEPEIIGEISYGYEELKIDYTPRIGVDEAGKGDFFGALCVASVYADEEGIKELHKIGVKDSKTMQDTTICKLAIQVKRICKHHIVRIGPPTYNELYGKFRNLNTLLAWGHSTAISELYKETQCSKVIVDQFAGEHLVLNALKQKDLVLDVTQRHRAEEDLVVAAASILARASFVENLEFLGKQVGQTLPKGASKQVKATARSLFAIGGAELLDTVVKRHFKTYNEVVQC